MSSSNLSAVSGALVYTNREGKIVYANLAFSQIMGFDRDQPLLGKMIHEAMGVPRSEAQAFLGEPALKTERPVVELKPDGATQPVWCVGEASYDHENTFLGWSLSFTLGVEAGPAPEQAPDTAADNPAQTYMVSQIAAIQTLLARLIGFGVRDRMEAAINALAASREWRVAMSNGAFAVLPGAAEADAYEPLLAEAVRFAVGMAGARMIGEEMRLVETRLEASVIEGAERLGLRRLIPDSG